MLHGISVTRVFLISFARRRDGICVDQRYLRFLRAVVRWLINAMVSAMNFAFLAIFAVKLRCVPCAFAVQTYGALRTMLLRPLLRRTRSASMALTL